MTPFKHDIELIAEPQLFNFLTNKENNIISWEYQPNTDYCIVLMITIVDIIEISGVYSNNSNTQ